MSNEQQSTFSTALIRFRPVIFLLFVLLTGWLGWQAAGVQMGTDFRKMVPLKHEFIQNLLKFKDELSLGNDIRIAVKHRNGTIFDADYQNVLRQITDEIFYFDEVDKSKIQSIWTPNVRWVEVTEEGFIGGEIIPPNFDGSPESLAQLQANVLRSGQVGRLVADDFTSAIVYAPLLETDAEGNPLDYSALSEKLEQKIRQRFQSEDISVHIVGFAKKMGDLIAGAKEVSTFFVIAVVITFLLLLIDSRCLRSSLVVILCSAIAVVWQVGLLTLMGKGIDPYSMLIPFLIFAIGVSHGVQLINEFANNSHNNSGLLSNYRVSAAQLTLKALWIPALLALVSDALGFMTLYAIDIEVIQDLAMTAALGVFTLIFTNLLMIPLFLSYFGVNQKIRERKLEESGSNQHWLWRGLSSCAAPKFARYLVLGAVVFALVGLYVGKDLKIGDLDPGAPELWPDSRYNLDDKFINEHYSVSADVFVVMVKTPQLSCTKVAALEVMDRFMWHMDHVPGVQSVISVVTVSKRVITGFNEGNWKWATLSPEQNIINNSVQNVPDGLMNVDCSLAPVIVFLDDHKAATLERVVAAVQEFAAQENDPAVAEFLLASGNSGIEAATNETIKSAQTEMKIFVYGVVSLLCLVTFASIRAVLCIIIPLALTSILCQALMAMLGIGVKVATLPVIALGVGVGVDYGIYIYSRLIGFLKQGLALEEAYFQTLKVTGKAVCFTGLTLAIGVGTWIFSDIKFQANMGVLLTFMFLWNMVGAVLLLPALAHFLVRNKYPK